MILRRIELRHFGRFGEVDFTFRPGLNLVAGPNEAGKTTLMEAIPAVLFGVRQKERYRPWGRQGSCGAALEFSCGERRLRIERDLLSDRVQLGEFAADGAALYSFDGKVAPLGRSSERAEYLQQLERLFGNADEDLFRASLFCGQGSLELAGEGGLSGRIKALLSGFVEVDYDRVLASLQDDYFQLTRSNPWGKDKTRERELDEVRLRIGELEQQWYQARTAQQRLEELRALLAAESAALHDERADHDKGVKYLDWVRRQWQLEEKEVALKRDFSRVQRTSAQVETLQKELQEVQRELARTGLPRQLPDDLPFLFADAEKIRKEMVALQSEAAGLRKQLLGLANPPWRLTLGLSGLCLAGGIFCSWRWPEYRGLALAGAGVLALAAWGGLAWRALKLHAERNRVRGQVQRVEQRREEMQDALEELDDKFRQHGMSPSAVEIVRMQKNFERHRQLCVRLSEIESALNVLDPPQELNSEKVQLTRELVVISERMEQDKPLRGAGLLPAEELPEAEAKLAALAERIRAREQRCFELARDEAALLGELRDLQQIEEEGERLREQELRLQQRRDALALGYDLLREAVQEFRQAYLARFAGDIGHYLGSITHGRHAAARLDDDFAIALADRAGAWHPLAEYSRGTTDAAYFAVRLALTRQLAQGRPLPLLLDDPLVNFDRARLADALKLLERLAAEHQVILFTHSEPLLKRGLRDGWQVVVLEEAVRPAAAAARAGEKSDDGQLCFL